MHVQLTTQQPNHIDELGCQITHLVSAIQMHLTCQ